MGARPKEIRREVVPAEDRASHDPETVEAGEDTEQMAASGDNPCKLLSLFLSLTLALSVSPSRCLSVSLSLLFCMR